MTSPIDGHDINAVVFRYSVGDNVVITDAPARADEAISQACQKVIGPHRIVTNQIVAVHAEWEPTAADFPNLAETSSNFERPESGDWDAALQQAAATRAAAMHEKPLQEGVQEAMREPVIIPILRMTTSPPPMSAYLTLLPNQLYVLVARATPTPRGTLSLSWVLQNHLIGADITFEDLLDTAFVNLGAGLKITGHSTDDGSETLLEFTGVDTVHMPAAAIAIPNFHEQVASFLGGDCFLAGITCHDKLHIVRADSDFFTTALEKLVFATEQQHEDLLPTLVLIEPNRMRIVAQKGGALG
jgi:hypothetical protein